MKIENRITLGIIDGQLVAQVESLSDAGGIFEYVKPWVVLDIPLPAKGEEAGFEAELGGAIAAHLLATKAPDKPAITRNNCSNQEAWEQAQTMGEFNAKNLEAIDGVGEVRAGRLLSAWEKDGKIELAGEGMWRAKKTDG